MARLHPLVIVLQRYDFFPKIRHDFLDQMLILTWQNNIFSIVEDTTELRRRQSLSSIFDELS